MVTSHDVARLAGVSQPTVSRALRDEAGVSEKTRARVREAARLLGYVPSEVARALSTRQSRRIGIVSAELTNPFYPALIGPLHAALAAEGYRSILITDRGDEPLEIEPLIDGSVDGVVLTTSTTRSQLPHELARRGVPFVFLNRVADGIEADACVAGNREAAARVADLVLDLGHTRVGAVLGPEDTSTGRARAVGFRDRLAERGIGLSPRYTWQGRFTSATGRQALRSLLELDDPPTALFCANDVIALGVLDAAREARLSVPDDLTVVGFDDIPFSGWAAFDLTTMRTDLAALADAAAGLLLERIRDPQAALRTIVLEPELVLRGTHASPRVGAALAGR